MDNKKNQQISKLPSAPFTERSFLPGLAKISARSMSGLRAATARARHPPRDSPTRYMGLFGEREFCDLTVLSTSFTNSEPWKLERLHYKEYILFIQ